MKDIEPGSFHIEELESDPYADSGQAPQAQSGEMNTEVYFSDPDSSLGKGIALFTQQFGSPKKVLYPACGTHVIDKLLPDAEITYVDPCEEGIRHVSEFVSTKAKALALPIEKFETSEKFNLVISLNSHAPMNEQLKQLQQGGFVFCNNYFGTQDAEAVFKLGNCTLRGVIDSVNGTEQESVLITSDLEDYRTIDTSIPDEHIGSKRKRVAEYYIFQKIREV